MTQAFVAHLLESTAFALTMGLLTLAFRANGAHVRFWLWFAASVKFLIPFSLFMAAGKQVRWETAPAIAVDLPWSGSVYGIAAFNGGSLASPALSTSTAAPGAIASSGPSLALIVLLVWAGGVVFLLGRWTLQGLRLRRALKESSPSPIPAPIPVRFSWTLFEPGLVGIVRPVLLLPEGIAARFSPEQLALVIEHELCHWRRRDNLTATIHMLAALVFWFHPLIWWIGTRMVAEREQACDETVVAGGNDPKTYADSILEVCRFYVRSPLACASGVAGASLTHRVERIMENPMLVRLSRIKLSLLATVAAGTFLLPMAAGLLTPQPAVAQAQPAAPAPGAAPAAAARTTASPGTEAYLRRHIASLQKGQPNYEEMASGLENAARSQMAEALPRFQKLGALKSLTFMNVGPAGNDVYEATFENGRLVFRISPIPPDGKVASLGYQIMPTPAEEAAMKQRVAAGKPDPEREALLRRAIAADQKGEPDYEIMSPGLTTADKQQRAGINQTNQKLGKFKSLTFLHVDQRGWDVYDATYENGHLIWRVGPLTDDRKLQGLLMQ